MAEDSAFTPGPMVHGAFAPARRCLVAVCHNGPVVFRQTAQSLMELGWGNRVETAKQDRGFAAIDFAWYSQAARVDTLRDAAATDAIGGGYSHLLFLDADMVWPTDVLTRMLARWAVGVVSGLYCLKTPPYAPVALRDGKQAEGSCVTSFQHDYAAALPGGADDLREQDVVGMGCTLIPVSVFGAMGPRPWFEYGLDDDGWPRVSEDVPFCQRARAAGVKVWLDPAVRCGHITTQIIDHRWHQRMQRGHEPITPPIYTVVAPEAREPAKVI